MEVQGGYDRAIKTEVTPENNRFDAKVPEDLYRDHVADCLHDGLYGVVVSQLVHPGPALINQLEITHDIVLQAIVPELVVTGDQ